MSAKLEQFRRAFEATSLLTGESFFRNLVKGISETLGVKVVWVAEFNKEQNSMSTMAFLHEESFLSNFTYLIEGTPCETVINSSSVVHFPERIHALFPRGHKMFSRFNSESYIGTSLHDVNGEVIGNVAILDNVVMTVTEDVHEIIRIIKSRAEAELQRVRREKEIMNREHQLRGLINGVRDLLINLDEKGRIVMMNTTAELTLGVQTVVSNPLHISHFLTNSSKSQLLTLIETLNNAKHQERYVWIPESLEIISKTTERIKVEGTLSRYELDEKVFYTLVLRNQDDKAESDERIRQLIDETEYVHGEMAEIKDGNQLVGDSGPMKRLLQNIYMVAHTDATVLIQGETGTGKELVARHIHQTSNRRNKPIITVNCGAIPAALMESEFFGHTKGAFTGATSERKGRFLLADGGTIFLDEIGELPLDLQVKLLRVIQESEFEPVGSTKTIKVDVRIVAATHRNLLQLSKEGKFREDLYYRLNVFPIEVPALRDRQDDVVLIANTFIQKFGKRVNRKFEPLIDQQKMLLKSYSWPGNIRELQNIIERSVILSTDGRLDLNTPLGFNVVATKAEPTITEERILTKDELLEFEKQNLIRALKATNWKVSGKDGAAALLHMVPSTLSSRINALGIQLPKN